MFGRVVKILLLAVFLSVAVVQSEVMVQWGASGGESGIVTNHADGYNLPWTWTSANVVSTDIGDNGYYTNSAGRTPTVYGACSVDVGPGGRISFATRNWNPDAFWVRGYLLQGTTNSAMVVWQDQDYLTSSPMTVTNLALSISQNNSSTGTIYWLVEKSGKFYVSQESYAMPLSFVDYAVDASSLSWNNFTPYNLGTAIVGNAASITLNFVSAVGFYYVATRVSGDAASGVAVRYFVAKGEEVSAGPVFSFQ